MLLDWADKKSCLQPPLLPHKLSFLLSFFVLSLSNLCYTIPLVETTITVPKETSKVDPPDITWIYFLAPSPFLGPHDPLAPLDFPCLCHYPFSFGCLILLEFVPLFLCHILSPLSPP